MRKALILLFSALLICCQGYGKTRLDTLRLVQCTYLGVPLVGGSLIETGIDQNFRNLRTVCAPSLSSSVENYLRFSPAAVMVAMKLSGVESRSTWGEMITADAVSFALMASVTEGLKYTIKEERPDGSGRESFPSGHTATAFMAATMLQKEYGYLSPWIGVGAYSAAATTGMLRVLDNHHWMSDVMAGAGIGIMSTEFGYWISDAIFHRHESYDELRELWRDYEPSRPSFVGFYAGCEIPLSEYDYDDASSFRTSTGASAGYEGAWFWNNSWGAGARVKSTSVYYSDAGVSAAAGGSFLYSSAQAGIYFQKPVYKFIHYGAKALVGIQKYERLEDGIVTIPSHCGTIFSAGASLGTLISSQVDVSFLLDYNLLPARSFRNGECQSTLSLGIRTSYRF